MTQETANLVSIIQNFVSGTNVFIQNVKIRLAYNKRIRYERFRALKLKKSVIFSQIFKKYTLDTEESKFHLSQNYQKSTQHILNGIFFHLMQFFSLLLKKMFFYGLSMLEGCTNRENSL